MDRQMIDAAAIPAANDRTVIRIREALRDRQAQAERGSARATIAVQTHSQQVLQVGAL